MKHAPTQQDDSNENELEKGLLNHPDGGSGENDTLEVEEGNEQITDGPNLSYIRIFLLFLGFGFRAWGGPVPQIEMMRQQLVIEEKWITPDRFRRVLAVYQALPGPEATELACYFGMIAGGRFGAILGGIGFILPGFCLMLITSWLYVSFGIDSVYIKASMLSLQPCVTAMVFRAVHRLGEGAFSKNGHFSLELFLIGMLSALSSVMQINFFISLLYCGILYALLPKKHGTIFGGVWILFGIVSYVLYVIFFGLSHSINFGSLVGSRSLPSLFVLGLLGGLLTFGGAYTAIPFIQQDVSSWMTTQEFLDGIGIANIMPAPLVIFVTFVGFVGGHFLGAIIMTIGMFLPAFSFTLIGHNFFEKIVHMQTISNFLDGVTAAVIGLIAVTAFQLLKSAVSDSLSAIIFVLTLAALYHFNHRFASIFIIVGGCIAGQVLYVPSSIQ